MDEFSDLIRVSFQSSYKVWREGKLMRLGTIPSRLFSEKFLIVSKRVRAKYPPHQDRTHKGKASWLNSTFLLNWKYSHYSLPRSTLNPGLGGSIDNDRNKLSSLKTQLKVTQNRMNHGRKPSQLNDCECNRQSWRWIQVKILVGALHHQQPLIPFESHQKSKSLLSQCQSVENRTWSKEMACWRRESTGWFRWVDLRKGSWNEKNGGDE